MAVRKAKPANGITDQILSETPRSKWLIMIALPVVLFTLTLFLGRYHVPFGEVAGTIGESLVRIFLDIKHAICHLPVVFNLSPFPHTDIEPYVLSTAEITILRVRLPRAIMALLVGAGLSMSGASFQGMFQNPLVSPFVLGVSAGASFGAAIGLVIGLPALGVQALAFVFGIAAVTITYLMSHLYKVTPVLMLVLSGMVVSAFFQAMLSLIKFTADGEDKLPAITFWLMGSLSSVEPKNLPIAGIPIIISVVGLYLVRWKLNVLSMGDRESRALGINNERIKMMIIICTTVITSSAVAFCGIIGWVGQVIPHFCRMVVGPDHKALVPATMLVGAAYLLFIDNLCRLFTTVEIPLGILTAVIGAPVFAVLLRKTKGGWN